MPFLADGYVVGLVHGMLLAGYLAAAFTSFHLVTGAHRWLAGSWGEDNTHDELRKARRRKLVVGWVDNLEVSSGDVDHLVITCDGRVLALDSKWRVDTDFDSCRRLVAQAEKAAVRGRNILRHLGVQRPEVRAVVVLWGGAQSDLPAPWVSVDGVPVVRGRALREWLTVTSVGEVRGGASKKPLLNDLRKFRREISTPISLEARRC